MGWVRGLFNLAVYRIQLEQPTGSSCRVASTRFAILWQNSLGAFVAVAIFFQVPSGL